MDRAAGGRAHVIQTHQPTPTSRLFLREVVGRRLAEREPSVCVEPAVGAVSQSSVSVGWPCCRAVVLCQRRPADGVDGRNVYIAQCQGSVCPHLPDAAGAECGTATWILVGVFRGQHSDGDAAPCRSCSRGCRRSRSRPANVPQMPRVSSGSSACWLVSLVRWEGGLVSVENVTVLFTDMVGSTALASAVAPGRRGRAASRAFRDLASGGRRGGRHRGEEPG